LTTYYNTITFCILCNCYQL